MNPQQTSHFSKSFASTSLTLIQLAKSEDQDAWESLSKLYRPLIRFWCRKYGVTSGDVDDVAQNVFRSIYTGLERFEKTSKHGSFRSWIWTITRNQIRDYFKRSGQKVVASGGTDAQVNMLQIPETPPDRSDSDFDETGSLTYEALKIVRNEIEEHTFQAFWRSTIDDVGPYAVAEELKISVDSVYQAKSRVLKRLRDLLD